MTVTTFYYPSNYGAGAVGTQGSYAGTGTYTAQFQSPAGTYTKLVVDSTTPGIYTVTFGYGGANPVTENVYQTQYSASNISETSDGTNNYILTNGPVAVGDTFTIPSTGSTTSTAFVPNPAFETDPTCFVSGTMIRTVDGDVAVEALRVGDLVVTSSGAHRPIRWLGHRTLDLRNHPAPANVQPIRIAADAFAPARPARDLFVSPGHSICVDILGEILIPAAVLVNGSTVAQVEVESVTYWHVELDSHDVLIAENLPAESYLEMDNRTFFAEAGIVTLGATPDAPSATHADFCRPFLAGGPIVDLVRSRLRERAMAAGWTLSDGQMAGLHVVADGLVVRPDVDGLAARFVLPADATDVWLVSETGIPSQLGIGDDGRRLGVCLRGLSIDDGLTSRRDVALDDTHLCVGFHACEDGIRRWTAGRARLPAMLWDGCRGQFFLRVDLASAPLPHWVAPIIAEQSKPGLRLVRAA
jgi:hypothetical protein